MTPNSIPESEEGFTPESQPQQPSVGRLPDEPDTKTIIGSHSITEGGTKKVAVPIGGLIGKYQIRSQLGEGGMGAVYLAFDPIIEREVAIKVLTQEVDASKVELQRFLQEARSIGRLNHPNVVSIFDIDQWYGQYYLVMELLAGGSLADVVEQRGPLPWQEACQMIAQAASGLAAAHAAGMVHRDIKPENLMLTKDGHIKVVDFGLSKLVDSANDTRTAMTKQGQILGTPQYMSPEQFEASELDSRTDIYSLGASLFRLLTARFPYQDCATIIQTMMAHLNKPAPAATPFNREIPVECDHIISRAMAKRPQDRYQNAFELADELIGLIQSRRPRPAVGSVPNSWDKPLACPSPSDQLSHASDPATPSGVDLHNGNHEPFLAARKPAAAVSVTDKPEAYPTKEPATPVVVIVEPSKMLAAMMKDAVTRVGATRVNVFSSKEQALLAINAEIPDLLITAMQLPDGLGIDLFSAVCALSPLNRTCVVLNSNDSKIDELILAGSAASRILTQKKVRPDDLLRVVHAVGPCTIAVGPIAAPLDPLALRLVIVCESGKLPEALADLVRQIGLLDVMVLGTADVASIPTDDFATVILHVRTAGRFIGDDQQYANSSNWLPDSRQLLARHLLAEVQFDGQTLFLRAVYRQGVTASVCQLLNLTRLTCLLQSCRST